MDYSHFPLNNKLYSGAEKKIGITIGHEDYIVKFQKKTAHGFRNNHISEYLGCRIMQSMGFDVQEVYLGTFKDHEVVVIKDFVKANEQFVAFNDLGESSIEADREKFQYSYEDITQILSLNNKLEDPNITIQQFWNLYILDALLGNFDRHGGNWGFIKVNNKYTLSPIFDNGSCLYPNLTDIDEMQKIIHSVNETEKRIFMFPTSQIKLNGQKSSYYEVIKSLKFKECNQALSYINELYNQDNINSIIDETPFISFTQKEFYKYMIHKRYELIIKNSYERLKENERTSY
jgi:hypothetical protein